MSKSDKLLQHNKQNKQRPIFCQNKYSILEPDFTKNGRKRKMEITIITI